MASVALFFLSVAFAQQDVVASDRSSDGQATLAGEGSPLNPDPVALAVAIAEHVAPVHGMLALGREALQKMVTLCVIRNKRGFEGPQNKE